MENSEIKKRANEIIAPFMNQPAIKPTTTMVKLKSGETTSVSDSHFGVLNVASTYNMITDARLTTGEVIERVVRSNYYELRNPENAELLDEVRARITELRQPKEYTGPVKSFK